MNEPLNQILILFAHPRFEQSRINRALLRAAAGVPGVTVHDLYEEFPDFNIQVEQEKALLAKAQIVIWQHPLYMYGAPALLKQWLDLVLEFGWAHGKDGSALQGKIVFNVLTSGGARESYRRTGRNRFTIAELLAPFDQTASLCQMIYLPPFAVQGTYLLTDQELDDHAARYRRLLDRLAKGDFQADALKGRSFLNDWPDLALQGQTP
ncbi:MAG: NAD(P)H-dependent oxidoreductase [Deltaproteobacteria bacterium]|nr:NAD(P)H-dependent oxidoreductase [Deltaproteobacteria bacterium]